MNINIEFNILELVYEQNFTLNSQLSILQQNLPQKNIFTQEVNINIEFSIFKLVQVPNFSLNWQFSFFGPSLPKKIISGRK